MKQISTAITPAPVPRPRRRAQRDHQHGDDHHQDSAGNRERQARREPERHQRRRMEVGQERVEQRGAAEQGIDRRDVAARREARRGGEVLRPVRPYGRISGLEPARVREDGVREDRR